MANKFREPYVFAWAKWHLYRKRRSRTAAGYATAWAFRQYVRACAPGGLMIDGGANVGDVTALFVRKNFTVYAFEPDPRARAVLEARLKGASRLTVLPQALGASDRRASFFMSDADGIQQTRGSSLIERTAMHGRTIDGDVVDLVGFIKALPRPVTVLKLDVEGAEAEILERLLDEGLHERIDRIFVEMHDSASDKIRAQLALIRTEIARLGIANIDLNWP